MAKIGDITARPMSELYLANMFCMNATAKIDPRQKIPDGYNYPAEDVRVLRGKLLFEELMEYLDALGLGIQYTGTQPLQHGSFLTCSKNTPLKIVPRNIGPHNDSLLVDSIDACCDVIFVAVGTLVALGAHDITHIREVCLANIKKFPNGQAKVNADGKFLKPKGWQEPNHQQYITFEPLYVSMKLLYEVTAAGLPNDEDRLLPPKDLLDLYVIDVHGNLLPKGTDIDESTVTQAGIEWDEEEYDLDDDGDCETEDDEEYDE